MADEVKLPGSGDRLPPQNVEAEEAILGGILLDPEAIGRICDVLTVEAFSLEVHRIIYRAATTLHSQSKPTDLMSVTTWLADHNCLEKVGGTNKLVQLVDRTVSAVNIDQYAALVMDKYLRRKLINAGYKITDLGFKTAVELPIILDQAEQEVFSITQERPAQGLVPISDTLIHTFQDIENRQEGQVLPGLLCDFYDLDAMTGGFQRSDLIIVAGRPSMGKCCSLDTEIVLADGSVATIQKIYNCRQAKLLTLGNDWKFHITKASAFVDDGIKPVFRVTTRLGKFVETTITHPYLTINGWKRLGELKPGDKIAVPRRINIFGTETLRECEVKLLAYLIGDGNLTDGNPRFTNCNPLLEEDFSQAVSSFAALTVRLETSRGTRTPSLYVKADLEYIATKRQIFAQSLKAAIKSKIPSQRKLAQALEINPSLVACWMQGKCVPNQETFDRMCNILQMEAKEVVKDGLEAIRKNKQNQLKIWLKELDMWGKNAHEKTIPEIIFNLNRTQVALFLNRLFSTDGWATVLASGQAQLGYATVSEKLARQIQHLLLRFGIIAALKKRSVKYKDSRRQAWQLDITDAESIKNFISEIGIFGKEEALNKVQSALEKKKYQTNRDLIPVDIWDKIAAAKGSEAWAVLARRAGIKGHSNIHVGKRSLTRERLMILASALDNLPLQQLAMSDVYWDEIVSIEPMGYKQVYDLTIPETHNFVANDICVHNTAICLSIAHNIANRYRLPIAIFSLEMSKEQLVQRLLASEAGIESNYLRSGRISQNQWESLSRAIGNLSELPIFIDDAANITVTEMRSQARRLQAENGGELGLVLIDYLQLMEGGGDNRVQELSKITRSLKGLARELKVPVIALSQLSRSVEARTNKRPMMSDLRESGCLTGDSRVTLADSGVQVPIRELVGKSGFAVWALNEATMKLERAIVSNAFATGVKPVWRLTTRLGRTIRATGNHKFLTIDGWKRLDEMRESTRIALPRCLPSPCFQSMSNAELGLLGHLIGDGCTLPRHAIQYTTREPDLAEIVSSLAVERDIWKMYAVPAMQTSGITIGKMQAQLGVAHCGTTFYKQNLSRERASKLALVVKSDKIDRLANSDVYWDEIVSIEPDGEAEVYDLTVPNLHNFIANNIVVHNSLEQDADVVIMLYREEYYMPDTPDRGIAEVIISKHRNGPTGTVKLLFDSQFTRFRNLASPKR